MLRLAAVAIALLITSFAHADPRLLSYTTPFTPTGELAPAGTFQRSWSTGLAGDVAYGLSDHVEARLQLFGVMIVDELQLRVSLLPASSRLRVVATGNATGSLVNGGHAWLGGTLTAAVRGDGWSVHASARMSHHLRHDDDLGLATAGGMVAISAQTQLFVDVGQVAWRHPGACDSGIAARRVTPVPTPDPCNPVDAGLGVAVGVWWWSRGDMGLGVSAIIARVRHTTVPIAPLLTWAWYR